MHNIKTQCARKCVLLPLVADGLVGNSDSCIMKKIINVILKLEYMLMFDAMKYVKEM